MRTALLVCDHVHPRLQKEHGTYPHMFDRLFPEIALEDFFVCDGDFPVVDDFDAFIISGSKLSVYDDTPWIHHLEAFTRDAHEAKKKILGVCFGHQMIAQALGGRVERSETGYLIGVHEFQFLAHEYWMQPSESSFPVLMLCQDQVTKLAPGSKIISKAVDCPVGMFTIDEHILAIQGHPEFTKEYNRAVFESRVEKIGQKKIDQAIASFANARDFKLIQKYLLNFLIQPH